MKKLFIAGISALILILLIMAVNYLNYRENDHLLIGHKVHGGEITIEYSPGLRVVHIYAMMEGDGGSKRISFDIVSFIISFVVFTGLIFLFISGLSRIRKSPE